MIKALPVLAVVAILGTAFFTGQKSFGSTVQYDHADVIDAVNECEDTQFIGGCMTCTPCKTHEYAAGGCSYFKDTFCTLCTPIKHCPTSHILCNDQYDHKCVSPGCDSGYYIGPEENTCEPCTVCKADEYVVQACQMSIDTECARCPECGENQYVSNVCKVDAIDGLLLPDGQRGVSKEMPTDCTACVPCEVGQFCSVQCLPGDIHNEGQQTTCSDCEACQYMFFATDSCKIEYEGYTECTLCSECEEGEYIESQCDQGSPFDDNNEFVPDVTGTDVQCAKCSEPEVGEWTVFPCSQQHTSDAVHQKCSTCQSGEYKFAECTATSDTVCPSCPDSYDTIKLGDSSFKTGLQYCKSVEDTDRSQLRCAAVEDDNGEIVASQSNCGEWTDPILRQNRCVAPYAGDPNCGKWETYCQDDYSGKSCCYHEHESNCGTLTSRERGGRRNGYVQNLALQESIERNIEWDFVGFCRDLCDEFPDCMAFEIKADGTDQTCYFKASYTQNQQNQWVGADESYNCWSNTCRQNSYVGKVVINYNPDSLKSARIMSEILGGRRR